jgi:chorismate lyase
LNSLTFSLLADKGSLTDRFKQLMGKQPCLTRLSQGRQFVSWQERQLLSMKEREMALVREIQMGDGEQDWMFARTVVPNGTLKGQAKRISFLNETPIGNILFGRNGATRTSMDITLTWELPQSLLDMNVLHEQPLWQRCSIFEFSSGPLMVTELFLPECPIYSFSKA